MSWIWLVVIAQFINAIVALIDKFIVTSKKVSRPYVYTFYTCLLSAFSISIFLLSSVPLPLFHDLIPVFSEVKFPTFTVISLSFISAVTFFVALNALFTALSKNDASDVVPVTGAVSAVTTLIASFYFIHTSFEYKNILGFILLVTGTAIVSHFRFDLRTLFIALFSGMFFGFHTVIVKLIFFETNYSDGFFWSRLSLVIVALLTLLWPDWRRRIFKKGHGANKSASLWILGNKLLAGAVAIIMFKAIELGDIGLVQALGGLQFLFILLITLIIHPHIKKHVGEKNVTLQAIIQKIVSILLIALGFWALF